MARGASGHRGDAIVVRGARANNLRDVSLHIPVGAITVFTGVSWSGKSSLVFDTIAAESQRQLNDMFPVFVRNRLPQLGKPDVDEVSHLSVAVVVDTEESELVDTSRSLDDGALTSPRSPWARRGRGPSSGT